MGKNQRKITLLVLFGSAFCLPVTAFAEHYSPAVPFQNKEAPAQIIGGVYIPAHEEPVMIQPGSVPFAAHPVSNTEQEQQALNNLARNQEAGAAQSALANLQRAQGNHSMQQRTPNTMESVTAEKIKNNPSDTSLPLPAHVLPALVTQQEQATTPMAAHNQPHTSKAVQRTTPLASNTVKHLHVTIDKVESMPVYIAKGGEQLSASFGSFLAKHHWKLLWNDRHDMTPYFTSTYSGKSVVDVVNQIQKTYPQFKIQMWGVNRVVTVTPYTNQNAMVSFSGGNQ